MLTIFSTPKPFAGHINVIQRNAIRSWQRLHPDVEIILVGDDPGTAEVCRELGLRHIPEVQRNRYGTKYLASIYDQAQQAARHPISCHANCDIVLMSDFRAALESLSRERENFLMAGRRWDVDVREPLNFADPQWDARLRTFAREANRQRPRQWIDYFVFRKGLFTGKIPPFVIGRPGWDNWLLWYAKSVRVPVVDASKLVMVVHQNHDYGYHPEGERGVWEGEEAQENYRLGHTCGRYATLANATYVMDARGLRRNYGDVFDRAWRVLVAAAYRVWFALLNATRPLRQRLGLRSASALRGGQGTPRQG